MRRLPALVAALLLPAAQPLLLGTALSTASLLVSQAPAQAQSAEAVGKVAQAITVRIEGATQGSGVLVKRDGNRYTVLTAWHVVSGQRPGEELDIYTPDGQRHLLEQGSIKRLGEVDLAVVTFTSPGAYEVARVGDVKSVSSGSNIYVSGFPLPTSAVPTRIFRFLKGDVLANATVAIPNGYQLLYSNPTLPGMSGGAALNAQGKLVGIHGQGETDAKMSEQQGVAVKTGTNQAVPIAYYSEYSLGAAVVGVSAGASTADDYLAQAVSIFSRGLILGDNSDERAFIKVVSLMDRALKVSQNNSDAYAMRARARVGLGQYQAAIDDADMSLLAKPNNWNAYFARANAKDALQDAHGAIADYSKAIEISAHDANAYNNRGGAKLRLADYQGAISDYSIAISINPLLAAAHSSRSVAKHKLNDDKGAIYDATQAIKIDSSFNSAYSNRALFRYRVGDKQGACADYKTAVSLGNQSTAQWLQSEGGAWCRNMP